MTELDLNNVEKQPAPSFADEENHSDGISVLDRNCNWTGLDRFLSLYHATGQIVFLPDAFDIAQNQASTNSAYLSGRSLPVSVTGRSITRDPGQFPFP